MLCSHKCQKKGSKKVWRTSNCGYIQRVPTMSYGPMPGKPVFVPIIIEELSDEDSKKAIEAVNLIEEKRYGNIKGRSCANGIEQKGY